MNIGFYLLDIEQTNKKHQAILKCINELYTIRPHDNIVLFNNKFSSVDPEQKYYTLHISEAKYFKGILFVFDIKSAMLTKSFPAPKKQILFIDKLEWSEKRDIPYMFWKHIYNHEDFELITANETMEKLCDNCWRKPLSNLKDLNGEQINAVLQKL
jgi:hypothetical protein